jgi:hypothetical protein
MPFCASTVAEAAAAAAPGKKQENMHESTKMWMYATSNCCGHNLKTEFTRIRSDHESGGWGCIGVAGVLKAKFDTTAEATK